MKKRVAVWIHGGIGGGNFSQGQPVIGKVVADLATDYEVLVYSQFQPNREYVAPGFIIFSAFPQIRFPWCRWFYLVLLFFWNHTKKPHQVTYAFWGYPAGVIAVLLGKLLGKPSIIHLQGGDTVSMPKFRYGAFYGFFSRKFTTWAYNHASVLIALTQFQKQMLIGFGIRREIEVIPYGPDLTMFQFDNNKFQNNCYRFIHIGNHNPIKDQITLLKAFCILARKIHCSLKIVGEDALNGSIKKYSVQLGIQNLVIFEDPVPYKEIPRLLHDADIILQTSLYEGQAMVISEAAASGVLLAGTRVGLLADLGDTYGIIVDVGEATKLAEKMLIVIQNRDTARSLIDNSKKWAMQHDHQWTIKRIKFHLTKLT